ncbi:MAG: hypothetical protein ACFFDM_13370 [Candidatus Thorarchaeota archaeon]
MMIRTIIVPITPPIARITIGLGHPGVVPVGVGDDDVVGSVIVGRVGKTIPIPPANASSNGNSFTI